MRKFRFPQLDTPGLWMVGLGLWCNMVAGCVYALPDFAWGLSKVLAVGLVIFGGWRILDAIADRVADARMAPEKAHYCAQVMAADESHSAKTGERRTQKEDARATAE